MWEGLNSLIVFEIDRVLMQNIRIVFLFFYKNKNLAKFIKNIEKSEKCQTNFVSFIKCDLFIDVINLVRLCFVYRCVKSSLYMLCAYMYVDD
jgi:hypothetical protein